MTKTPLNAHGGPAHEHLSDARLAAVAGGERADAREEVHLASCRKCASVYADLVRVRVQDLLGQWEAPDEILSTGRQVVRERSAYLAARSPDSTGGASRGRFPIPRPAIWASGALAALIAILLLMELRSPAQLGSDSAALPELFRTALIQDSSHGIVHPWVADADAFDAPVLRGADAPSASMKEELDVLRSSQQESEALLQATASLIAAYQAADQLANARAYLDLAREHFPEDGGIRDLELMQIYREGNLELAEEMLRERLEAEPEDVLTRLNLAILLHERGHPGSMREAKSLAAVLVAEQPESALGLRAQKILE